MTSTAPARPPVEGPSPEAGCAVKPAISQKPKTISVNGVVLSRAAIARETQNHPASKPVEAWQAAARALVVRELLLQEARRLALTPAPLTDAEGRRETDDEAVIRQLVEREVITPQADDASCRRYYAQNKRRFVSPTLFEVAHILLPHGDQADTAALQAAALLSALRSDPDTFPLLAKLHSACPSREVGGHLGQIGPGQTVPEFEAALPALPVAQVAPQPVTTRFGLHIVRVERRIDGRELPFGLVRERIAAWLEDKVRRTAVQQYIALLAGKADIVGIEIAASRSPLVQ